MDKVLNKFEAMLAISEQMIAVAKQADEEGLWTEKLTKLMEEREALIKVVEAAKTSDDIISARLDDDSRLELNKIISKIQQSDQELAKLVENQMQVLRGKISSVKQNVKANTAYLGHDDQAEGWFFDSRE